MEVNAEQYIFRDLLKDTWGLFLLGKQTRYQQLSMKKTFKEKLSCLSCKPRTVLSNMAGSSGGGGIQNENYLSFGKFKCILVGKKTKTKTNLTKL